MPEYPTGTFELILNSIASQQGSWPLGPGYPTTWVPSSFFYNTYFTYSDAELVNCVTTHETVNPGKMGSTITNTGVHLKLGQDSTNFILDGIVTPKLSRPPGFQITSITWKIARFSFNDNGGTWKLVQGPVLISNLTSADFVWTTFLTDGGIKTITQEIDPEDVNLRFSILSDPIGLEFVNTTGRQVQLNYLGFEGTYRLWSLSWDLNSPPSNRAIQPGDTIEFTSNPLDTDPLDFTQIETIELVFLNTDGDEVSTFQIDEVYWIDVLPNLLRFVIPPGIDPGEPVERVICRITSTQFEGTVDLQTFYVIYFYNAPGVYAFTDGQTHDTYYSRIDDEIGTVDTKIPDPTGRTGYY